MVLSIDEVFAGTLEGVQLFDETLRYIYVNPAAERQNRRSADELVGRRYGDCWPGVEQTDVFSKITRVLVGRAPVRFDNHFHFPDGSDGWFDLRIEPFQTGVAIYSLDVTAQRQLQAQQHLLSNQFRMVLDVSPIAMSVTDPHTGRWIQVNRAFCRLSGRQSEDLLGKTEQEVGLWESRQARAEFLSQLEKVGLIEQFEARLVHSSGEKRIVLINAQYLVLSWGACILIQGVDITERESLAQESKRIGDLHRVLETNISDVVWILDTVTGHFTYVSPSVQKLRGYSPEEVLSLPFDQSLTEESQVHIFSVLPSRIAELNSGSNKTYRDIITQPTKDGGVVVTETTTQFQVDHTTGHLMVYGCSRDISDRLEAENRLDALAKEYQSIFETSYLAIARWDADGRLVMGNHRFHAEVLHQPAELPGRIIDYFPLDAARIEERVDLIKRLRKGRTFTSEVTAKGGRRLFRSTYQPLFNEAGDYIGFQTFALDVTEQRYLADQALNGEKLAHLGLLAAGIAHDLNNVMAGLYGNLEVCQILAEENNLKRLIATLGKSTASMRRAQNLTRRLSLLASRRPSSQSVINLADKITDWVNFSLSGSSIEAIIDVQPGLWLCDCNESEIEQAIDNFVINARQASPESGHVWVTARNCTGLEPMVELVVEDEGPGFSPEALAHLWEPHFTTKENGNGLGLSGAKVVIDQHEGFLTVGTSSHGGALVRIALPAIPGRSNHAIGLEDESFVDSGKVIVMDDDGQVRESVAQILGSFGFEVISARNGHDAIAYCEALYHQQEIPRFLLLDLTIPGGLGGRQVADTILQKHGRKQPILGMTGYFLDSATGSDTSSFDALLTKPFSRTALINELGRLLTPINAMKTGEDKQLYNLEVP